MGSEIIAIVLDFVDPGLYDQIVNVTTEGAAVLVGESKGAEVQEPGSWLEVVDWF